MKQIYIIVLFIASLLVGCYEDKGNYSYLDLNNITIKNIGYSYGINEGDTVLFSPVLKFSGDSLSDDLLKFSWKIDGGKVISNEKEFSYVADTAGSFTLYLTVYNKLNDLKYFWKASVSVASKYKTGWMVLAEKDGKSRICFVQPSTKTVNMGTGQEEKVIVYKEFLDAYKNSNDGKELGSNPIMLYEHWPSHWSCSNSEVTVLQQGGQGVIDLEGTYLKQAFSLEKEFVGQTLPDDFKPVDVIHCALSSYILNYDGRMFVRKQCSDKDMHSGYFLKVPAYFQGGLSVGDIIPAKVFKSRFFLIHDKLNNRFLGVRDSYNGDQSCEMTVIKGNIPEDIINLNNIDKKFVCCKYASTKAYYQGSFFAVYKEPGEEKYYAQEFALDQYISLVGTIKQYEIPNSRINENSMIVPLPNREYVFISSGSNNSELYLFDRGTRTEPVLIADFGDKKITCIQFNKDLNDKLAIGFETGEFLLYDISDKFLGELKMDLLYTSKNNFGKIVDILDKKYYKWQY